MGVILTLLISIIDVAALQANTIDSLKNVLEKTKDSKDIILLNSALSEAYFDSDYEESKAYAEKSLELSKKSGDTLIIAQQHYNIGKFYFLKGNPIIALAHCDSVENLLLAKMDSSLLLKVAVLEAAAYRATSHYFLSANQNIRAMEIAEDLGDKNYQAAIVNNLGNLYMDLKEFDKALDAYKKAEIIYTELDLIDKKPVIYCNIGFALSELDKLDSSIMIIQQAIQKYDDNSRLDLAYFTLGRSFYLNSQFDSAIKYAWLSRDNALKFKNQRTLMLSQNLLGLTYIELENVGLARNLYEQALQISKEMDFKNHQLEILENFANLEEKLGNHVAEARYLREYMAMNDSIYNNEMNDKIAYYKELFEVNQKENTIAQMEKAEAENQALIAEQKYNLTLLVSGIIIVFLLGASVLIFYLRSIKANKLLAENNETISDKNQALFLKNTELEDANREKNGMIQIFAHDLASPLNKTIGLLQLMDQEEHNSPKYLEYKELIQKVCVDGKSMIQDLLDVSNYETLERSLNISKFNICQNVNEAVESIKSQAREKNISIHHQSLEKELEITSDPVLLSRILDNLLSNALKFTEKGKNIFISLNVSNDSIEISIKDEGPGISLEDQKKLYKKFQKLSARPTGGERSNGLGLSIVKTLVEKLKGDIHLNSRIGEGTEFVVTLPRNAND